MDDPADRIGRSPAANGWHRAAVRTASSISAPKARHVSLHLAAAA